MAKTPKPKIVTKKHLARMERERLQRRNILFVSIAVFVVVAGLIIYGVLQQNVIQPSQPIARVNNETITTREYQTFVRYQRRQLIQQYLNTYQNMQFFAGDPDTEAFFEQTLQQIQFQLEPTSLGQQVLNDLIDDRIIRQEAARRGITVTDEEIEIYIQQAFGYYPEGFPPTPTLPPTPLPTSTLSPTQLALFPPSPTPTEPGVPEVEPTAPCPEEITATPDQGEEMDETPESNPTPPATADITPTATLEPTPYTLDLYQQDYQELLENLNQDINFSERDLKRLIESQLYRTKLIEEMTFDIQEVQEQVWVRHILVEDEETAQVVLRLLDNGEDFSELASIYSTDTSNKDMGGDLGWFRSGRMVSEFEEVAFQLEIGEISDPVQTQFGFHIIQKLGHEERPLSHQELEQLRQNEFNLWLLEQRQIVEPEIFPYWSDRTPIEPSIPPSLTQF
ncbi:MAG: peptidylprolyl isomerase [Anaerolineales bacterium]